MKILLLLIGALLLGAGLWQAQRYAAFGFARDHDPPLPQELLPPAYLLAARAHPPRSITFFGASNFARSPMLEPIARELSACAGQEVRVRAVAKAGANSDWGLSRLEEALTGTDILIVGFSGNDASLWRGMPLARSKANHEVFVRQAKDRGVLVFLTGGEGPTGIRGINRLIRPGLPVYAAEAGSLLARREGLGRPPAPAAISAEERRRAMPDGLHSTPEALLRLTLPRYLAMLRPLVCPAPEG